MLTAAAAPRPSPTRRDGRDVSARSEMRRQRCGCGRSGAAARGNDGGSPEAGPGGQYHQGLVMRWAEAEAEAEA